MKMPAGGGAKTHVTTMINGYYESTNGIIAHGSNLFWLGWIGGMQGTINITPK